MAWNYHKCCLCVASGVCCIVVTASVLLASRCSSWSRVQVDFSHFSTVPCVGSQLLMLTYPMCWCDMQIQLMVTWTWKSR